MVRVQKAKMAAPTPTVAAVAMAPPHEALAQRIASIIQRVERGRGFQVAEFVEAMAGGMPVHLKAVAVPRRR